MKIITCASYYGSGSSALTDLVSEYEGVKTLTDFEFRFLYDIDGVSDLEYHLCECHNRHNSGHALKRFMRLSQFNAGNRFSKRYEIYFNNQYKFFTEQYLNSLVDFSFKGWWFNDLFDKGIQYYYLMQLLNKILTKIPFGNFRILKNEITYCSHPRKEEFLKYTRQYVSSLMKAANPDNLPFLEIDQIVPSQNIKRILRYFDDEVFVFVVDRDPRDIYTLEKYYWKGTICPTDSPEDFCDWYLYTRNSGSFDDFLDSRVVKIQFEDLIFNYERTVKQIEEKTGLDSVNHNKQFMAFNPKRSIHNTQIWEKHNISNEIAIIEKHLKDYLYPFGMQKQGNISGINTKETTSF